VVALHSHHRDQWSRPIPSPRPVVALRHIAATSGRAAFPFPRPAVALRHIAATSGRAAFPSPRPVVALSSRRHPFRIQIALSFRVHEDIPFGVAFSKGNAYLSEQSYGNERCGSYTFWSSRRLEPAVKGGPGIGSPVNGAGRKRKTLAPALTIGQERAGETPALQTNGRRDACLMGRGRRGRRPAPNKRCWQRSRPAGGTYWVRQESGNEIGAGWEAESCHFLLTRNNGGVCASIQYGDVRGGRWASCPGRAHLYLADRRQVCLRLRTERGSVG